MLQSRYAKHVARAFLALVEEAAQKTETKIDDMLYEQLREYLIRLGLIDRDGPDDLPTPQGGGGSGP